MAVFYKFFNSCLYSGGLAKASSYYRLVRRAHSSACPHKKLPPMDGILVQFRICNFYWSLWRYSWFWYGYIC